MGQPNIMKPLSGLLEEEGDRWMRSLTVAIECGDARIELDALQFEELVSALQIRHLAVQPRTRDVIAGTMPARRLHDLVERRWSSIDSYGLNDLALRVQGICTDGDVRWGLA